MSFDRSTIFALSSGRGPAAIAVVRISGPRAGDALKALTGRLPAPRRAALARLRDPDTGEEIDQALALFFPGPHSETGEDTAELQLHGGRAVIAGTLAALSRVAGLRPAEAGEFTRRAFENGKLDLTEVEGLADLIYAETAAQRRQALRQLRGLLGDCADAWRTRLIEALALVEAGIDFSDEADVTSDVTARALAVARALQGELAGALQGARRGERLRDGLVVAIAGPPNAGKSTVLNRIARREAAIVSPLPGTTRDVIEVHLDLEGYPVTLLDTAGIRESDDPVEREGVARARARAAQADLVLWVVDARSSDRRHPEMRGGAAGEPRRVTAQSYFETDVRPAPQDDGPKTWLVRNKIDLVAEDRPSKAVLGEFAAEDRPFYQLSATTGAGVEKLIEALADFAREALESREPALVTRERQRRLLEDAEAALKRALDQGQSGREDLLAEELRVASQALGRLTGRVDVEDILDVIFRDFCIGK